MKTADILLFNDYVFVTMQEGLNGHDAAVFTKMDVEGDSFIIINLNPAVVELVSNEEMDQVILSLMKDYKNYIGAETLGEAMTHYMNAIAKHVPGAVH